MKAPSGRSSAMPFIMLTVLIDMMSVGIVAPVLPKLLGNFMSNPTDLSLAYGAVQVAFAATQFFSSPILGALSDRYGRRPILLMGLMGMGVSFLVTAAATEFWMLLAVRLFAGMVCANIAVANAYVADITEPEKRARNYGLLGAMFGLGFILGPVTGGLLGSKDHHLPFYLAGVLCLANCVYGYFMLPESLAEDQRRPFKLTSPFVSLAKLRDLKGVEPLLWVLGLSMLAQFTLHSSWFLFTQFKFGWSPRENGLSLFLVGIMAVIVQGVLMRQFEKFIPVPRLALLGLMSSTVAFVAWGYAPEGWMMYAIIVANFLGYLLAPTVQSLISNAVDPQSQGESMGAVSSITSVSAVLGPLMSGPMLAVVSHLPPSDWRVGAPFYACAVIQAVATAIGMVSLSRYRHTAKTVSVAAH
jgi:MFS transporter, DHA1 family, tetracycline resistance protein